MDAQAKADALTQEAYEALSQRERALRGLAYVDPLSLFERRDQEP